MPGEGELPVYQENFTSAALDGARIACVTASVLVSLDGQLGETQRVILLEAINLARRHLDIARMALPVETTSLHTVRDLPIIISG